MIIMLLGSYSVYAEPKTITFNVDGKEVIKITVADEVITDEEPEIVAVPSNVSPEEPDCE
tara:strand:+ start:75 stop:254 length:180 start_codon:yes stop_codon:yes gene_type:complete